MRDQNRIFGLKKPYFCHPMEYFTDQTSSGIRTIFKRTASPAVHIGIVIGAGSRDEKTREHGLAHFIEHTVFKGTQKRKSYHILSYIDNIGGEINAFTSREETCLYASVPLPYAEKALDLLSDVFAHSTFPEKEIEREKEVVIEEIQYYRDLPDETILDEFEELVFPGHPLGRAVLGTPDCVRSFTGAQIRHFMAQQYTAERTVLSCTGNLEPRKWQKMAEKYFGNIKLAPGTPVRKACNAYQTFEKEVPRKNHQGHCVMGATAYSYMDPHRVGLVLLNNILGGPGNNSRLNLAIRERKGLVYNIESNYAPYTDTGIFSIYMGADHKNIRHAMELTRKELMRLCNEKLGIMQMHHAKQQIIGQMTVGMESNLGEMLSMGKSLLIRGCPYSLEQAIYEIRQLSPEDLLEIANDIFNPDRISALVYLNKK